MRRKEEIERLARGNLTNDRFTGWAFIFGSFFFLLLVWFAPKFDYSLIEKLIFSGVLWILILFGCYKVVDINKQLKELKL